MRPNIEEIGVKVYECFTCGARTAHPDAGTCPSCGAELLNLGRARDL